MIIIKNIFWKNRQGTALIEFSVVLPVLLVIFFGAAELFRYITVMQKVERTAFVLTSILNQYTPATPDMLSGEVSEAKLEKSLFPQMQKVMDSYYDSKAVRIIASSVTKDDGNGFHRGVATGLPNNAIVIDWQLASDKTNGFLTNDDTRSIVNNMQADLITPAVQGSQAMFNAEINDTLKTMLPNENMLVIEVFYKYTPMFESMLDGLGLSMVFPETIISRSYARPREGDLLTLPPNFN